MPPLANAILVDPAPLSIVPFAALLLSIALLPLFFKHHWERYYHFISIGLGAITVLYYLLWLEAGREMLNVAGDYLSFMTIIGSFFVISGGILISVRSEVRPAMNVLFLLAGALLGNVIGTTGASMLLIRPWIRMNRYRFTGHHLAFFIFLVSNIGGGLIPLGPPLVMGYMKGVPFWWALQNCWLQWIVTTGCVVAVFYFVDRVNYLQAPRAVRETETAAPAGLRARGLHNFLFIAVALGAIAAAPPAWREFLMITAAAGSWFTTPRPIHEVNEFTFGPLKEIAWLFAGIFATMTPALDYMVIHAGSLPLHTDRQFYWFSGLLSGVLDNAPTYLTFLAAALGIEHLTLDNSRDMAQFLGRDGHYLAAISLGSSFFGALTYIGNGPNLIVKSIADHSKIRTPGFLAFAASYSLPVLIPIFALIAWMFF